MKNKESIFKYGSTWLRADFHLHTRKDLKYFNYEGDENYFVSDYVDALTKNDIRFGVITNHNKFDYEEYKQISRHAKKNGIYILPGTELSVREGKGGIHVLIVFDETWLDKEAYHITKLLDSFFLGQTPSEYENSGGRSDKDLIGMVEKLEEYAKQERDYFLVFAHVEGDRGLWSELGDNILKDIGQLPVYKTLRERTLGFQKVRTRDREEEIKNLWSGRFPAKVDGSDCKSIDDIGRNSCWLKLGAVTFEAIKYALTDHENRVACKNPGQPEHSYIKNISFKCSGGFLGEQSIMFSPELNTFIGIRGSGKSAVLETLRYVMDIPADEKALDGTYKQKLVEYAMGSGGKAAVEAVDPYGQSVTVSRILGGTTGVYIDDVLQPGISIGSNVIKKPLYFGQKDLASSGEGFEKKLIEKMIAINLREIREKIDVQRHEVTDAVSKWKKILSLGEEKKEFQKELNNTNYYLSKHKEYKLEEKLDQRLKFQKDVKKTEQVGDKVAEYISDLENLIDHYEDDLKNMRTYRSDANDVFFKDYFEAYDSIVSSFQSIKENLRQTKLTDEQLKKMALQLKDEYESLSDDFAKIERELAVELKNTSSVSISTADFIKQVSKSQELTNKLEFIAKIEKSEEESHNNLLRELDKLNSLWLDEFNIIKLELEKITKGQGSLSVDARFKADKKEFLSNMKDMFRGSGIRENDMKTVIDTYSDFGEIFKNREAVGVEFGSKDDAFESYFIENLATLLTWQPPNLYLMKYHGRELKDHSLGQRASALLLFLLGQSENDLIIIDQPEDDIDNQTIYKDVIKTVKEIKPDIQFIFATHNANIPVLGDAEQVHSCSSEDNSLSLISGGIDDPDIQKKIIDIMEGGRDAFTKRREIYSSWNASNS